MTLAAGTKLGAYEVIGPLGSGGMGEVYRARDSRLSRDVALKVLSPDLVSDREWLARFREEARTASAIGHPAVVTVYETGDSDAGPYIAMELVEGLPLRELLSGGALPLKKSLQIAALAADGLAAAHAAGVVHRDLKPENVMIGKSGQVRILDFGLAKAEAPAGGPSDPTVTWERLKTRPGTVLGTVGYMSPEQAGGGAMDFRSDQFSLGSMLYEMLTGRRAFQRATAVETMAAILREEPEPIATLDPRVPAPIRWIVDRCLAKDPTERYASTLDLARDLATVRNYLSTGASGETVASPGPARRRIAPAAAIAGGVALFAAGLLLGRRPAPPAEPTYQRLTFKRGSVGPARFAPDGRSVVFGARWLGAPPELFMIRTESPAARPLGLTGLLESISSSGEMAILKGTTLARVPLLGGTPREVAENVAGAGWGPGESLAVIRTGTKFRLEYPIGTVLFETDGALRAPRPSPDGSLVAFLEGPLRNDTRGRVSLVDRTGKRRRLSSEFEAISPPLWHPSGKEIWFGGLPFGGSFSVHAVTLDGKERLVKRVAGDLGPRDLGPDGSLLVARDNLWAEIAGIDAASGTEHDLSWLATTFAGDLSDDGKTFVFMEQWGGAYATYVRPTDGSPAVRLGDGSPQALSPDGAWVLAVLARVAPSQLVLLPTRAGEARAVTHDAITHRRAYFFPDGRRFVFVGSEPGHAERVYVQDIEGGAPRPLTGEGFTLHADQRAVSPDGRWVLVKDPAQATLLWPADGGEPRRVNGIEPRELPIRFGASGDELYVRTTGDFPVAVSRVDIASGRREAVRSLDVADHTGLAGIQRLLMTPDARYFLRHSLRYQSDLYLVTGLK